MQLWSLFVRTSWIITETLGKKKDLSRTEMETITSSSLVLLLFQSSGHCPVTRKGDSADSYMFEPIYKIVARLNG